MTSEIGPLSPGPSRHGRAGSPEDEARASRVLFEAFKHSARLEVAEQNRLWQRVARGVGGEISWNEYYDSLQALTPEALGRIFFEMRKLEQLHPEVRRPRPGPAGEAKPHQGNI